MLHTLVNNPWFVSIGSALLVSGAALLSRWLFTHRYSFLQALFTISIATIIFSFGPILQAAVQFFIEGNNAYWSFITAVRTQAPGALALNLFFFGAVSGIPTGLVILKGTTFKQRVAYGAIWAPVVLVVIDIISIEGWWQSASRKNFDWDTLYFGLLSDLTGGVVAGFLIGALSHLYYEHIQAVRSNAAPK
jgi:hypothetical protein